MADPTTVPTGIQPNLPAALSELGAALLLPALLIAVIAYFCGCFNGAVIVSKYILRDDVRTHGSGNAGLTNFYRTFGGPLTFVVILTDVLKAVVAVWVGILAAKYLVADELLVVALGKYWAGAFCLLGHMFPCMFHFKGGKGSIWAGASFPFATWFVYHDVVLLALAILLGGLIVWKHRGNLKRILNGTESKFSLHHKKDEGAPKA